MTAAARPGVGTGRSGGQIACLGIESVRAALNTVSLYASLGGERRTIGSENLLPAYTCIQYVPQAPKRIFLLEYLAWESIFLRGFSDIETM